MTIIFGAAAYNLLVLLVHNAGESQQNLEMVTIAIDAILAVAIVALIGPTLVWVALLPVVVAGVRFGWLPGLIVAGAFVFSASAALVVVRGGVLLGSDLVPLGLATLLLPVAALAGGVVTQARMQSGEGDFELMDRRLRNAREQMKVVYEMAATLSTSLNYSRVLDMVMEVSVHGLERLGMGTQVAGAILLFTHENGGTKLRVAASRRLTPADNRVLAAGEEGILAEALNGAEPVVSYNPHDDPELKYFAGFRASEVVLCIPLRAGFESYGVLLLGVAIRRRFRDDHIDLMQAIANQAIVSLQNASLYQSLSEEKERIIEVDEEARKQLARDLHDGPTQTISAVAMRISFIRRLMETKPEQAADELWKVEEMARRAAAEIRHMLFTLRPLVLESQGLGPALDALADKMKETHDQDVVVNVEQAIDQYLDQHTQGVVFYIVEEAVNNARKHAEAEQVTVRLGTKEDVVVVEIKDNGMGFDVEAVEANYDELGSLGMVNLRERAELVEGTLLIDSAPGKGTKISLLIPLERSGGKLPTVRGHA